MQAESKRYKKIGWFSIIIAYVACLAGTLATMYFLFVFMMNNSAGGVEPLGLFCWMILMFGVALGNYILSKLHDCYKNRKEFMA